MPFYLHLCLFTWGLLVCYSYIKLSLICTYTFVRLYKKSFLVFLNGYLPTPSSVYVRTSYVSYYNCLPITINFTLEFVYDLSPNKKSSVKIWVNIYWSKYLQQNKYSLSNFQKFLSHKLLAIHSTQKSEVFHERLL